MDQKERSSKTDGILRNAESAPKRLDSVLYIVRHGQTELNNAQVLQGRSDHPLNEAGIAQAEAAGAWFRSQGICFDAVYSSPLSRAIQTATLIAGDQPVITDERLIEMDYGPYEGMDLKHPAPEVLAFFRDFTHSKAPEGMEALSHVVARAASFMDELRETVSGNVLISTHAIAMKGILEYLTPASGGAYWSKYIGNCAVYVTELIHGSYTVPTEKKI